MKPSNDLIGDRTGIVFFKDYWRREIGKDKDGKPILEKEENRSGDHLDLWNGFLINRTAGLGLMGSIALIHLDLYERYQLTPYTKAKRIIFWEIK